MRRNLEVKVNTPISKSNPFTKRLPNGRWTVVFPELPMNQQVRQPVSQTWSLQGLDPLSKGHLTVGFPEILPDGFCLGIIRKRVRAGSTS